VSITCASCGKSLHGRQRRFCSRRCKNADTNNRLQSYAVFELSVRAFSNRCAARIAEEIAKCELVCANCHAEWHHPEHAVREPRPPAWPLAMVRPASCMPSLTTLRPDMP
jgi:endogenous inhibitor of DNA gyrase (YacG/DUF329 family)